MTSLSLPCSYKKESLLRIESTHIEFSKDLNRCLPSNSFHPVDGIYYTKARSGLILAYSYEGRKVSRSGLDPFRSSGKPLLRYGPELKLANIGQGVLMGKYK
ncbi:hypothetical protein L1987_89928 [Smallanthus sonchifolius]|nr:hypothetical protein L1987_89928 [Smallanthus sonchifolius]